MFHIGISKYSVRVIHYYTYSTLADCYILKQFLLNLVHSHPCPRGDFGNPNIMVFESNSTSKLKMVLYVTFSPPPPFFFYKIKVFNPNSPIY